MKKNDILTNEFIEEFIEGFEIEAPAEYCLQEDNETDMPWSCPWCNDSIAMSEWYDPEKTPYEMGQKWWDSVSDEWHSWFANEGNVISTSEEKNSMLSFGDLTVELPTDRTEYFQWYPKQNSPQESFFVLDPNQKRLYADWNGEIGNAVPESVYNGREFRFSFPSNTNLREVREIMEKIAPLVEKIVAGYSEEYRNGNCVGILNSDARDAFEKIDYALSTGCFPEQNFSANPNQ